MENIEEDITNAKRIIKGEYEYTVNNLFTKHSRIYPFTNENLNGCFDNFDFNNRNCLTVLGSSDQALDMCLRGACEITTFDINILTKYFFHLKKAAILSGLTKEEYISFFFPHFNINQINNYKLFSKISQCLSGDSLVFWTKLFEEFNPSIVSRSLFSTDTNTYNTLKNNICYLNENEYDNLREKLRHLEMKFINTDIKELPHKLSEMYDFMYLSNIMYYSKGIFNKQDTYSALKSYKKLVLELSNFLNDNGNIIVCYFFSECIYYDISEEIFTGKNFNYNKVDNYASSLQYTRRTTSK